MKKVNWRRKLAILAAPLVLVSMYPVYQGTARGLGEEWGWYAGFPVYWGVWCVVFPLVVVGRRRLGELFGRGRMSTMAWVLVALPPGMALAGRFGGGGAGEAVVPWIVLALVNGVFEEVLWRGVYVALFPRSPLWGVGWPAVWFALWHFAPGAVSMGGRAWVLVAGALALGLCLGWVAYRSSSIRWTAVSHVLAGLAQV